MGKDLTIESIDKGINTLNIFFEFDCTKYYAYVSVKKDEAEVNIFEEIERGYDTEYELICTYKDNDEKYSDYYIGDYNLEFFGIECVLEFVKNLGSQ